MTFESVNILAIETATQSCSVALRVGDQVFTLAEIGKNVHSQVLLSMVEHVLQQAKVTMPDIDAVAVGKGPGSFTGLRIGIGVAQGLAYGVGCPMMGISSLDALACEAELGGPIIATMDARMGEVYWCEYQKDDQSLTRLSSLNVTPPSDVLASKSQTDYQLVGNAWGVYAGSFDAQLMSRGQVVEAIEFPQAESILELAKIAFYKNQTVSAIDFSPEYVRNDVAKKSSKPAL